MLRLRLLTFAMALLFIPAFMLGVGSVWAAVFSFVLAYHFKCLLLRIVKSYLASDRSDDKFFVVAHLYKRLPLAILECAALVSLVPLVFAVYLSKTSEELFVAHGVDKWLDAYDLLFVDIANVTALTAPLAVAVLLYNFSWLLLLSINILCWKPLWEISNRFFCREVIDAPGFGAPKMLAKRFGRQYAGYGFGAEPFFMMLGLAIGIFHLECMRNASADQDIAYLAFLSSGLSPFLFSFACYFAMTSGGRAYGTNYTSLYTKMIKERENDN